MYIDILKHYYFVGDMPGAVQSFVENKDFNEVRDNAAGIPLGAYEDLKAFKLFVVDIGLLGCMTGLRSRTLLDVYYYTNDRG